MTVRRLKKRKTGDERFREAIDNFYVVDDLYKLFQTERDRLIKDIRSKLRYGHRPLGVHRGNFFAINAHLVQRKVFSQKKARELMGHKLYDRAFAKQKYVQIDSQEDAEPTPATTNDQEGSNEQ